MPESSIWQRVSCRFDLLAGEVKVAHLPLNQFLVGSNFAVNVAINESTRFVLEKRLFNWVLQNGDVPSARSRLDCM
jgi:hypothetical protein